MQAPQGDISWILRFYREYVGLQVSSRFCIFTLPAACLVFCWQRHLSRAGLLEVSNTLAGGIIISCSGSCRLLVPCRCRCTCARISAAPP